MSFFYTPDCLSEQDSCLYHSGADSPEWEMDSIQIRKRVIHQAVIGALKSIRECKGVENHWGGSSIFSQEKVL